MAEIIVLSDNVIENSLVLWSEEYSPREKVEPLIDGIMGVLHGSQTSQGIVALVCALIAIAQRAPDSDYMAKVIIAAFMRAVEAVSEPDEPEAIDLTGAVPAGEA